VGVCLDTANNLRLCEDPLVVAEKLAPFTRATHVEDVWVRAGDPKDFSFWPSVPLGRGLVDIARVVGLLKKPTTRAFWPSRSITFTRTSAKKTPPSPPASGTCAALSASARFRRRC
jgi:hypothetical protein